MRAKRVSKWLLGLSFLCVIPGYSFADHVLDSTDYDSDKLSDLLLYDSSRATFVLRRSSTLQFQTVGLGSFGDTAAPGDFNGDGATDLATFNRSNATWSFILSDGTVSSGPFGPAGSIPAPGKYHGNPCSDLALYHPRTSTWTVANCRLPGVEQYTFGNPGSIPVPGDYTGDGRDDLALFSPKDASWRILDIATAREIGYFFGLPGDIPMQADYDQDGKTDAAVFRPVSNHFFVRNELSGQSNAPMAFGLARDQAFVAHFDGNLSADLGVFRPGFGTVFLLTQPASVPFQIGFPPTAALPSVPDSTPVFNFPFDVPASVTPAQFCAALPQFCLGTAFEGGEPLPPETPTLGIPRIITGHQLAPSRVPGDYDRDSLTDIGFVRTIRDTYHWQFGNLTRRNFSFNHGKKGDTILSGDINGDGRFQPIYVRANTLGLLSWHVRNPDGSEQAISWGVDGDTPLLGDFDCDGKDDPTVVRTQGAFKYWYSLLSTTGFTGERLFGLASDTPMVADRNGDSCDDMLVVRSFGGGLHWFYQSIDSNEVKLESWGLEGDTPLVADLNGDQIDDFIVARNGAQKQFFARLSDTAHLFVPFGQVGDVPLVGNFTGANRAEIAVYRHRERRLFVASAAGALRGVTIPDADQQELIVTASGQVISILGGGDVAGEPEDQLECDIRRDFRDGERRGALWKPFSDNTGRPVILLPPNYWTSFRRGAVYADDGSGIKIADVTKRTCCPNGGRAHFDVNKHARELNRFNPIVVRLELAGGRLECREVPRASQRYD